MTSGHHTELPKVSPHSSVSKETGLSAEEDDVEITSPASSQELKRSVIFNTGRLLLVGQGLSKSKAGGFLGKLVKDFGLDSAFAAVQSAAQSPPVDGVTWLRKAAEAESRKRGRKLPANADEPACDWAQLVDRYVRSGIWPAKYGGRPDEQDYRGPVEPLVAIMANGKIGQLDVQTIRINIDRLRAARTA